MLARDGEASEREGGLHDAGCPNCRAPVTGPYCAQCGQSAHLHRSLTGFVHDIAHGVFHYEGKLASTLPLLLTRPGELTRRYIDGERVRFVAPVALFLLTMFLLFAVAGSVGHVGIDPKSSTAVQAEIAAKDRDIAALQARLATAAPADRAKIGTQINELETERAVLTGLGGLTGSKVRVKVEPGSGAVKKRLAHALADPELAFYKLKTGAYKYGWMLIPLSLPFVWLLFAFDRRFTGYDHLIFITYSLCFVGLMLALLFILSALGAGGFSALPLLAVPWHFYRQLKGTYGLSRGGALWRTVGLVIIAFVVLSLAISLLAMVNLG